MARTTPFLNNEQWNKLEPLLPKTAVSTKGGRPWQDNRQVLEGILWVLKSGARWRDLPSRYPSPSTCWRRLRLWEEMGIWLDIWYGSFILEEGKKENLTQAGITTPVAVLAL